MESVESDSVMSSDNSDFAVLDIVHPAATVGAVPRSSWLPQELHAASRVLAPGTVGAAARGLLGGIFY